MLRTSLIRKISSANSSGVIATLQAAITEQSTKVINSTPDPVSFSSASSSSSATDSFVMNAIASKAKPRNTQILSPEELAAASEPTLYAQVMHSDMAVSASDFLWATFGLGAGDAGAIFFCTIYATGCYWDSRTRMQKSRFRAFLRACSGAIPYYAAFWMWKKYLAYIMDVPDMRGGVSSIPGAMEERASWQRMEQIEYSNRKVRTPTNE